MRSLPNVSSLQEAVKEVIKSNKADGYPPNRFIQATRDGYAPNLPEICNGLITKGETLQWLEEAFKKHSDLLTLEDFVSKYGKQWGFSQDTIKIAEARAQYFDQLVKHKRYS
jgi:hypothetical protein